MKRVIEPTADLLENCRTGNRAAFKELFDMYKSYAYNLVYKITGPRGDHEDLVQDVFFQIYLSLKSFKGNSAFRTWFHRIVINVCTRQWRYQNTGKRIPAKETVNFEDVEYAVPSAGADHGKQFELKNLVERALDTLDQKLRVPIVLNVYSEMELSEISEILDIPEGTVKSRLFTARNKIKEHLDGLDDWK